MKKALLFFASITLCGCLKDQPTIPHDSTQPKEKETTIEEKIKMADNLRGLPVVGLFAGLYRDKLMDDIRERDHQEYLKREQRARERQAQALQENIVVAEKMKKEGYIIKNVTDEGIDYELSPEMIKKQQKEEAAREREYYEKKAINDKKIRKELAQLYREMDKKHPIRSRTRSLLKETSDPYELGVGAMQYSNTVQGRLELIQWQNELRSREAEIYRKYNLE